MKNVMAILSMLHEPPADQKCSATRLFRGAPVLKWTLQRLSRSKAINAIGILCWQDQAEAARPLADEAAAHLLVKGPRISMRNVDAITAAQRWSDGWRGGLLSTCHFDLGFHGMWHHELAQRATSDAIVLIDPSAGLVDPHLIDDLVYHAKADDPLEFCFAPAPPGLGSILLRMPLLNRLAAANTHPGRLLHYHPDQQCREVLGGPHCAPVPTPVARSLHRFTLDSDRQIQQISAATESLNGQLMGTSAGELASRVHSQSCSTQFPREIVLELNTRRSTSPIFWPGAALKIARPDFSLEQARRLFGELCTQEGVRLTIGGAGDPLLSPDFFTILDAARFEAALPVHVETDLHEITPDAIARLATSPVDVVSVHLPALSPQTYARIMGPNGYVKVLENIQRFVAERQAGKSAVPIVLPVFTKCRDNFGEMEAWHDQWIRSAGSAVIRSPSTYGGRIPDVAQAEMTPPGRKPCYRLTSRLTILSDGRIVSCEEDVLGEQTLGQIGNHSIGEVWQERFRLLSADHHNSSWVQHPVCSNCREWYRP